MHLVRDFLVILLVALCVSFLVKTFLVRSFYIPSGSMEQTLLIDDRVLVNELVPDVVPLSRGDVVVFKDPGGWLDEPPPPDPSVLGSAVESVLAFVGLAPEGDGDYLIKRVIGLPGDTIECCNGLGQLSVNDIPIEEPYVNLPQGVSRVSLEDFAVTIPEDSLWVMGDNRYNSKDSRYNRDQPGRGFVSSSGLVGQAFVVTWPSDRWGTIGDDGAFVSVPGRGDSE